MKHFLLIAVASVSFVAGIFLSPSRYSVDASAMRVTGQLAKMTDHLLGRFWVLDGDNKWSEKGVGKPVPKPTPKLVAEPEGEGQLTVDAGFVMFINGQAWISQDAQKSAELARTVSAFK